MTRSALAVASLSLSVLLGCPGDHGGGPAPTHALSGTVTRAWGGALAGVTVALGGAASATATTDASGRYAFPGLADGAYTVTPALAGYVFTPSAPGVAVSGTDAAQDFAADGAYAISGKVSGSVQGGVSIALSGGDVVKAAAVSAAGTGAYAFTGIPNGTYTLTPAMAGHVFAPATPAVTVSGASATQDFTSTALVAIRGKVLDGFGTALSGITVRLTGGAAALATTDASGAFAFTGLLAGRSYTVTPATFGYAFVPDARTYGPAADVTDADFGGGPSGPGTFTYEGSLSYSGTRTGPVYVTVIGTGMGAEPSGGTGLVAQAAPWSGRPFTVRHVQAGGSVTVRAWMDTLGVGRFNAGADPSVTVSVDATASPFDLGALALADPTPTPAVASPVHVSLVLPFDGGAAVLLDPPRDANGDPLADTFRISWNDGPTVDETHRRGTTVVPAGSELALVRPLSNGTGYWFRVDAYLGGAQLGAPAVTTSPVTPAPPSGGATLSGTVTHPAVASPGALYVVAQAGKGPAGGVHFQRIPNPTGTETHYALTLPPGTYQLGAFVDVHDDGAIAIGEPGVFDGSAAPIASVVPGTNAGPAITVSGANATPYITTSRWSAPSGSWASMTFRVTSGAKLPLAATVTGPGLRAPLDVPISTWGGGPGGFELGAYLGTDPILPFVGDAYAVLVVYQDGTTETFHPAVTGLFAAPPAGIAPANGATAVPAVPTFAWTPPSGGAGAHGYEIQVWPDRGGTIWETSVPGDQTSIAYGADGTARARQLAAFTPYGWAVRALDANGNDATYQAGFRTARTVLPGYDGLTGTALDGELWQTPQLTRSVTAGGKAVLGVRADHLQARTLQGTTYTNAIGVLPGAGNRVTSLGATASVPASTASRTGTAVLLGGIRLIYQPVGSRGGLFPAASTNILSAELELFDDGSGLRLRRRVFHCDDAACIALGDAGISYVDPADFTASGVAAVAPAEHDRPYVLQLSLDETSGKFTWSVQGGAYSTAVSGTADVSGWASSVGMVLDAAQDNGFVAAQLFSRVSDEAGGSSGEVAPELDDVLVGVNRGTATPWDDFSSGGFSPARWGAVDSDVWLSTDGLHLSSAVTTAAAGQAFESTVVNVMYPTSFSAWQADVGIASQQVPAVPGSAATVALVGAFYNDGTPGGGAAGDVRARVEVQSGSAGYSIFRCASATCTTTAMVASGALTPAAAHPLGLGTVHTLLAQWDADARLFTFAIDDAPPVQVDPTQVATPAPIASRVPRYPIHVLTTGVSIGSGASSGTPASVEATVANVRGVPP